MFGLKIIKAKKFREMETIHYHMGKENAKLKDENKSIKNELSQLNAAISGKGICGKYCEHCRHGLRVDKEVTYNTQNTLIEAAGIKTWTEKEKGYVCSLDIPCKCFEMRVAECKQEEA